MAKKRVHEIAKDMGISSKELLAQLNAAGIVAKAAASSVDEADAKAAVMGIAPPAAKPAPKKPPVAKKEPVQAPAPAKQPPVQAAKTDKPKPQAAGNAKDDGAQRATRDSAEADAAGGPGKRRVVIDSQANRRPAAGGPQQGGPGGRRPRRRGGRRRSYEEVFAEAEKPAEAKTDVIRVNSGATVKDVSEYLGVPVPDVIKQLMALGEMATLTQTLPDEVIEVLAA
ncbi:MAG: translation initiation factor IF-2 N-terminal domain-containing protein, partial [Solirubrobacterales bacterium]|nr:translation initiation factor IF-2 N-terminal domain-containing protein [Solirubrobacterales bacterium]